MYWTCWTRHSAACSARHSSTQKLLLACNNSALNCSGASDILLSADGGQTGWPGSEKETTRELLSLLWKLLCLRFWYQNFSKRCGTGSHSVMVGSRQHFLTNVLKLFTGFSAQKQETSCCFGSGVRRKFPSHVCPSQAIPQVSSLQSRISIACVMQLQRN